MAAAAVVVAAAATVAPVEAAGVVSLVAEAANSVLETGSVPIRKLKSVAICVAGKMVASGEFIGFVMAFFPQCLP